MEQSGCEETDEEGAEGKSRSITWGKKDERCVGSPRREAESASHRKSQCPSVTLRKKFSQTLGP